MSFVKLLWLIYESRVSYNSFCHTIPQYSVIVMQLKLGFIVIVIVIVVDTLLAGYMNTRAYKHCWNWVTDFLICSNKLNFWFNFLKSRWNIYRIWQKRLTEESCLLFYVLQCLFFKANHFENSLKSLQFYCSWFGGLAYSRKTFGNNWKQNTEKRKGTVGPFIRGKKKTRLT